MKKVTAFKVIYNVEGHPIGSIVFTTNSGRDTYLTSDCTGKHYSHEGSFMKCSAMGATHTLKNDRALLPIKDILLVILAAVFAAAIIYPISANAGTITVVMEGHEIVIETYEDMNGNIEYYNPETGSSAFVESPDDSYNLPPTPGVYINDKELEWK